VASTALSSKFLLFCLAVLHGIVVRLASEGACWLLVEQTLDGAAHNLPPFFLV